MRIAGMPGNSGRFLSAIQNEFELPRGSRNTEQEKIDSDFAGLLYRALMYINLTEL
jgi:hypothetical protein